MSHCGSISHGTASCTLCLASPGMFTVATQTVEINIEFFNESNFRIASFARQHFLLTFFLAFLLSVAYRQTREAWSKFVQAHEQKKDLLHWILHYVVKHKDDHLSVSKKKKKVIQLDIFEKEKKLRYYHQASTVKLCLRNVTHRSHKNIECTNVKCSHQNSFHSGGNSGPR